MGQRGRSDPEIVRADGLSPVFEIGPDLRVNARDRLRDRHRLDPGEDVLDERASARAAGTRCAVHTMEQFAHRNDADRSRLVPGGRFERAGVLGALPVDEDIGVDQDGQVPSGAAISFLMSLTSSAKSSSTGGALAISSRKRSAGSRATFGGPMTAIGAPPRVISTSSPAATRFNNSEKERAASVAVNRVTPREDIR